MRQPSVLKTFLIFSLCTSLLFLIISSFMLQYSKVIKRNNINSLYPVYLNFSTEQIMDLFAMEIPYISHNLINNKDLTTERKGFGELLTSFAPLAPDDWIKKEIPPFSNLNNEEVIQVVTYRDELMPPKEFFEAEKNKVVSNQQQLNNGESNPIEQTDQSSVAVTNEKNKKVVFIYHTHNRESFLPELNTKKINEAFHPTKNITLVGQELGKELERLGIGAVVSTKDYWPELENYSLSYKYSLKTVQAALQDNKDYQIVIDIHRDGSPSGKEVTTRIINGKEYGSVLFVIGTANKNYKQNEEFALKIHQSLEKLYPGLSRGIFKKEKTYGTNGEYNQSIFPNSITIEIGGVYNSLEEEFRTARAIARAIADVYWDAVQVNAKPSR
ncbi:hypothetical protein BHF71_04180 [Vulcanibacillus modesticaldus]|uniref:Stage II sporulation protein P n=1 Tax=Vulcanibacillus modesticaldus TaxID=337097 RepID=A0A1D2YS92_9BACI|nr:stage II sporulation protein P [Vulcanibacillus modesticaldus]OEF96933.1 hypothetical protein BHF71_04180 [Vulcanibacillus modesticaldus]